jgi:hypothetical protein
MNFHPLFIIGQMNAVLFQKDIKRPIMKSRIPENRSVAVENGSFKFHYYLIDKLRNSIGFPSF